ncbi:hypothetical protein N3553_05180 [Pantoea dispersa]|jgi:hypothetical protein|uniref:hypothetical protein n=1 Tax=Pantoea dispersa TaxID=59814 RepID=UPI0021AFCA41|nr:hypothetical protein [Pantoea dispersa]MCT6589266.1 hypothetical protein [Pantoea dispersa]MCW0321479.1 hypothetical protein [Pantoea dispersa]MCW0326215.1 hypothetical protein [Pantoea dispersa]MCW0432641.1 hypothetical protein [Pantoea dispersa]
MMNFSLDKKLKSFGCRFGAILLGVNLTTFSISASPLMAIEVAETVSNINHTFEGINRVKAIYKPAEIVALISSPSNRYYNNLEESYISYERKGSDWLKRFYIDMKIPENLFIKEIPPLDGKSKDVKYFAYIITNLDKNSCKMLHSEIKSLSVYEYINPGKEVNTLEKRKGKCEDKKDNEIVVMK